MKTNKEILTFKKYFLLKKSCIKEKKKKEWGTL